MLILPRDCCLNWSGQKERWELGRCLGYIKANLPSFSLKGKVSSFMCHGMFVLLVQIQPSLWGGNDLAVLSQSMQSTVLCPREPWSQCLLPGTGALSAAEGGQSHEFTSIHSSSWGWRARYHTGCHWAFASLRFWLQKVGRGALLGAGVPNLWMRRWLEGA